MTPDEILSRAFEASREDKLRIAREADRAIANTRSALTEVLTPAPSGRFAPQSKPDFTVGRDERVDYPRIPSGPWGSGPQVPDEPALGFSVDDLEPCGEPFEQERAYLQSAATSLSSGDGELAGSQLPPPAVAASLSSTAGPAEGPSPAPEESSPLSSDDSATDPTLSSRGSGSIITPNRQLAAPLVDAEASRKRDTPREELRRGGAVPSTGITRRFG
jgi:hypothetical protein